MALTQSAWSTPKSVPDISTKQQFVSTCTVLATAAENDAYTLKTPKELDTSKPFTVALVFDGTPDGQALPIDIWIGWGDDFVLSGDGANVVATNGAKFKQIFDDCVLAVSPLVYTFLIDPTLIVADIVTVGAIATGLKVKVPPVPYFAFNLNAGSTLAAQTATWTIIQ